MKQAKIPPIAVRDRQQRVLELRESGLSPAKIAKEIGISPSLVYQDLKAILQRTQQHEEDLADSYRRIELQRLDSLQQNWWMRATGQLTREDGTPIPADEKAAQLVLRIMERRAKLLGLDAPTVTKSEVDLRFGDRLDLIIERGALTIDSNRQRREEFMQTSGRPKSADPRVEVIDVPPEDVLDITPEREFVIDTSEKIVSNSEARNDGATVSPEAEGGGGGAPPSLYAGFLTDLREDLDEK